MMRIQITDAARWAQYRNAVMPLIGKFGGKHVASGALRLEGNDDSRTALFGFESNDAIQAFWNSPDYVPVKVLRRDAGLVEAWAIPGPE